MLSQVSRRTQKLDLVLLKLGCRGVAVGQAMLVSATLSEEVEQLKAELMMAQAFPFMLQDSGSLQKVQKLPIFFVLKWNFPHLARLLQKTWYLIIFFFRTRLRLWRSLSLTGSDAAQAGGFEIGRAPCDWQAVTALPPCLDFHYRRVEIHVCQRLVCTWVYRFTLSLIKVMTPVEGPIFHMGGIGRKGNTAKHWPSLTLWPWSRFYFICHKTEKYLILYTLLSAWLDMAWHFDKALRLFGRLALCKQQEATADTGQDVPASAGQVSTTQTMGFVDASQHRSWQAHLCEERGCSISLEDPACTWIWESQSLWFSGKKKCCKSPWRSCNGFLEGFQISIFGFSWHIKSRQIWEHVFKSYEFQT